jgi:outer membrane protein assembly factor BamA
MVGGMATENGSQAGVVGDLRHWLDDRLQTRVFAVDGSINLDFFGVGEDAALDASPLRYNLDPRGVSVEARCRLDDSLWWLGLGYVLSRVDVAFEDAASTALPVFERRSEIGGLMPSLTFDSRDNMFTPTAGTFLETTVGLYDDSLGGDHDFQRVCVLGMHFVPLAERWFLGVRGDAAATFGDVPFYLEPFVVLRGVPMLRYQGETMVSGEAELRWQFWERFSLVGFDGAGALWNDFERYEDGSSAIAGGVGVRYELAREYGIHAGIAVAFGPEDTVLYIQVGSAWARP